MFTKPEFFRKGKCPKCREQDFLIGPSNGVVYNLKCKKCGSYLLVVPSKKKVEIIEPTYRW